MSAFPRREECKKWKCVPARISTRPSGNSGLEWRVSSLGLSDLSL